MTGGPVVNHTKELDPRKQRTKKKLLIGVRIAGCVEAILRHLPQFTDGFEEIACSPGRLMPASIQFGRRRSQ